MNGISIFFCLKQVYDITTLFNSFNLTELRCLNEYQ
jgi:hypothetical protein